MSLDDIERHTDGKVVACRNMRLGVWAGMRLGFRGEKLADYARDVMDADYAVPGPEDVIAKIRHDFDHGGVDFPSDLIRLELQRIERQVRGELLATD